MTHIETLIWTNLVHVSKAPKGAPLVRVEFHKNYMMDGPDVRKSRAGYESILMIRHVYETKRGPVAVRGVVTFDGSSRDEADEKMVAWIESHAAVEADFDAESPQC